MAKISVIINTFNEEKLIRRCLENLLWADEIVIIDMYSKDKTVEIAKKYTDKIYFHPRTISVLYARNFSLTKATYDWVLIVDPDEIVPPALAKKLKEFSETNNEFSAISLWFKMYFFDRPLKYAYPIIGKVRFFKKDSAFFPQRVHSNPKINGKIFTLPAKEEFLIEHKPDCRIKILLNKLFRYTTDEAYHRYFSDKENVFFLDILKKPIAEFFYRYIKSCGYKDGWCGFIFCIYMSFYKFVLYLKLWINRKKYKL